MHFKNNVFLSLFILSLAIVSALLLVFTSKVNAITQVVTTSSTTGALATQASTQRHLVRTTDGTLHSFVQMGSNTTKCSSGGLWWLYSTDSGTTWTCGGQLSSETTTNTQKYVDARVDSSDNIYLVYSSAPAAGTRDNANDVLYRKISYNGSSSWTVNAAQAVLDGSSSGSAFQYAVLELQGTTRIWLASKYFDGTNYGITTYYSDGLDVAPNWTVSQATMNASTITDNRYHYPTLVRYGTNIGLIYNILSGSDMVWRSRSDSDGLTTWQAESVISTTFLVRFPSFSAIGDSSGNIYLAVSGASQALFTHFSSSWSALATLTTTPASDAYISVVTDGSEVWVMYASTSGLIGTIPGNRKLVYKKGVAPFATANFDTNSTQVASYHGFFDKVWLFDVDGTPQYQEETTDASNTTSADVAQTGSGRLLSAIGDIAYFGKSSTFDAVAWELSTVGSGGVVTTEYCSAVDVNSVCTTWSALSFTASAGNTALNTDGYGSFTPPTDWQAAKINDESTAYYYLRIRTTTSFSTGPIGAQMSTISANNWGSLSASTSGVYGTWTENSLSGTPVHKVRYATLVTHSTGPFEPSSLDGYIDGLITTDTTPTLNFTLDDPDEADLVKYQIQIDDSSDFSSPILDYTSALAAQGEASFTVGQAAGSGSYAAGSESQTLSNASYYWRVKAFDNDDEASEFSTANSGSIAFIVDTTTWPMAGANPERTSWTSQTLPGDIDAEWVKPIGPLVSQHVQVIGAEDKVFVATSRGLYAFNANIGVQEWVYPTELPLGHSPTYFDGVLYVGGLDRRIHAISADTGDGLWTYEAAGGFSTSPVVANNMVYAGNRDGWFYAINTSDGSLAWKYQTGNQILQSAAFKAEDDGIAGTSQGTLFFASNDGYAYALNAQTGALLWRSSSKLPSNGFYSWWPVIYEDDVIFTRTTFGSGHNGEDRDYLLCPPGTRPVGCTVESTWTPGEIGTELGDWVSGMATLDLNNNSHGMTYADYFETFPEYRNHIYYNMISGEERNFDIDGDTVTDAAPVTWAGDGGTPSPPIVSGYDGVIYFRTLTRALGGFSSKTIAGWDVGTGIISVPFSNDSGQSGAWPGDEPNGMTAAGNKIYWNHCCDRYVGSVDISQANTDFISSLDDSSRQWRYVTSGGLPFNPFTNIGIPSDYYTAAIPYFWDPPNPALFWNENDKVGPTIYNGKMYTVLGNALIAFGVGGAGSSATMLTTAAETSGDEITNSTNAEDLSEILEQEVQEIIDAGHLKPSYFYSGGITTSSRWRNLDDYLPHYWHNPADTQIILLRALPFLSAQLQIDVEEYLQSEMTDYSPATYAHMGFMSGTQRDPYEYPPLETDFNGFTIPTLDKQTSSSFSNYWTFPPYNAYALWKYAEAGLGDATTLLSAWGNTKLKVPIEDNYNGVLVNGETVDSSNIRAFLASYPLVSNGFIAGYKGYVELAKLAGQSVSQYEDYEAELNKLLTWKVEDLMTFPDPQEPYLCESECYYESLITYYNFAYMVPELAEHLRDNAISGDPDQDVTTIIQRYQDIAPYWMMSHNGETQGEHAIQPYQQTHSLFQAKAQIEGATFDELVNLLDTPIVPTGDLYYIDNVVATLEVSEEITPTPTPTPTGEPTPTPTEEPTPTLTVTPEPTVITSPSSDSSSNSSSNSSTNSSPEVCTMTAPGAGTPWLYGAIPQGANSVLLQFGAADDPVDHYVLEYGTASGQYIWSATNIGGKDARTYTVESLIPNTKYYFRVRAGNGCATGNWSNEISATTLGNVASSQLLITDSVLEVAPNISSDETVSEEISCQTYTVKTGDSLWTVASELLGNGARYKEIIEQNKDNYSSLQTSNNLESGWELKYNCEEAVKSEAVVDGLSINVKVLDVNKNPVNGAKVTIHSKVQEALTDGSGIASFNNIEPGDHRVIVSYDGFEGEQAINLNEDAEEFNITITVEQKNLLFSPIALLIIGVLSLIIFTLIITLIKAKSNGKPMNKILRKQ